MGGTALLWAVRHALQIVHEDRAKRGQDDEGSDTFDGPNRGHGLDLPRVHTERMSRSTGQQVAPGCITELSELHRRVDEVGEQARRQRPVRGLLERSLRARPLAPHSMVTQGLAAA